MGDTNNREKDQDYSFSRVPDHERKSYWSLTIVWTGYVFVVTSMMCGGGLAGGLNTRDIILAMLLGNLFLSAVAVLVCIIAGRTGLTFALLTRYSFGETGSRLASVFVPVVNLGWYTIQAATYGHFIAAVFGLSNTGELIAMALSAIVMGLFALKGIKTISILGYVAIPAIIFLSLATSIKAVDIAGFDGILNHVPANPMTLSSGITAVIGTWVLSTGTCIADIMRYARSTKAAIGATLTGLLGGNIFMIICGALTSIAVGDSDLTAVLLSMGFIIPCVILMTTNIFTTNAANLYSCSLNLSNSFRIDRKKVVLILLVVTALATLTKPYQIDSMFIFLDMLGIIVPPLPGILLSDYYIVHKRHYPRIEDIRFAVFNPIPWITWGISLVLVFAIPFGLPALKGILISAVLYPILMKISKKKVILEKET